MKSRNVLQSPKLKELKRRRKRIFLRKAVILVLISGTLLGVLSYLSRLPGINIESIQVEGESIVGEEAIRNLVQDKISGSYIWLFPKSNILFFPKNSIKSSLANEFKRLENIDLSVANNRLLTINVTEREPAYLWCGENAEECYFMDKTGYIFDKAPYFSGDVYFRWKGASGFNSEDRRGSGFAPENFEELVKFKNLVAELGLEPVTLEVKDDGDAELGLKSQGAREPKILIKVRDDIEHLAENLSAALETEPLKTRMKKEYSKLEYLDLRFDNKVYSKFATP